MAFAIIILPRAHRQFAEASAWWRVNRPAAPALLDAELNGALLRLAENPHLGTIATWMRPRGVRRLTLHKIDYLVFYRVRQAQHRIEVLAFWHARRSGRPRP